MLTVTIPSIEKFNDTTQEFVYTKEQVLQLEHSLVSLSKWESKWRKPFLSKTQEKTVEETIDYVRCMTITQNVKDEVYKDLPKKILNQISEYINAPMTATTITQNIKGGPKEVHTAEIIYYWMIAFNIPFECQKWHLNRLLMLINVCNIKQEKPKPMGKGALQSRNAALNAARRKQLKSKG